MNVLVVTGYWFLVVLCEVRTDKAVVAVVVNDDVILTKILVPEGESCVPVNKLIG